MAFCINANDARSQKRFKRRAVPLLGEALRRCRLSLAQDMILCSGAYNNTFRLMHCTRANCPGRHEIWNEYLRFSLLFCALKLEFKKNAQSLIGSILFLK